MNQPMESAKERSPLYQDAQASVEALTSLFTQLDRTRSEPDMANLLKWRQIEVR